MLRRIESTSLEHGVAYPWWMPVLCKSGQVLAAFAAFVQRERLDAWQFPLVLVLLAVPIVVEVRSNRWLPAWVRVIPHVLAFAVLVITPIPSGPTVDAAIIVLGLVAGAISMGLGEYTSVRTQNDQVTAELDKELRELRLNPEGEADELVAMWTARGLPALLARQVADDENGGSYRLVFNTGAD